MPRDGPISKLLASYQPAAHDKRDQDDVVEDANSFGSTATTMLCNGERKKSMILLRLKSYVRAIFRQRYSMNGTNAQSVECPTV
jgi:hypothetical protein